MFLLWKSTRWQLIVFKVWTHINFTFNCTELNNKCNRCKNKLAEAINLSDHKRRQHKVNYFWANTICKPCPHIKLPDDILVMSEPTEVHHEMTSAGIITIILLACMHSNLYAFMPQNIFNESWEFTFPLDLNFKGLNLQLWKLWDENFDEIVMRSIMKTMMRWR